MPVEEKYVSPSGPFSTGRLGFTHVVTASPDTPVDLRLQAEQALLNLRAALEAVGASPADVVFVRLYVVDYRPEHAAVLGPMLEAFLPAGQLPASTWVGVESLAVPGFLIEIGATAVVESELV